MLRPPPLLSRTDTLFPSPTLFRSLPVEQVPSINEQADPLAEPGRRAEIDDRLALHPRRVAVIRPRAFGRPFYRGRQAEHAYVPEKFRDRKSTRLNSSH